MQTFLPYSDFRKSLSCLDYRRLGKQRVEADQLLKGQWANHPASKMWRGYKEALKLYRNIAIQCWLGRGYKNNMPILEVGDVVLPPWFGNRHFHAAHRSNLLRKNPEFYGQYGWIEPDDMEYVWPV